jgi:hypothetical protein
LTELTITAPGWDDMVMTKLDGIPAAHVAGMTCGLDQTFGTTTVYGTETIEVDGTAII